MTSTYAAISGTSRAYRWLVGVLAAIVLAGLVGFVVRYHLGEQTFSTSNAVPWTVREVMFIYFIGLSAGSLVLSGMSYILGWEHYRSIARLAVFLAILLLMGAMVSNLLHLGRPEKVWRLFTFQNLYSMFTLNSILYAAYLALSVLYLGLILAENTPWTRWIGLMAVAWAILVHGGTGAIFGFIEARTLWFSSLRPLEFIMAALASGVALLMLVLKGSMHFSHRELPPSLLQSLARLMGAFLWGLLFLIVTDKLTHVYAPGGEDMRYYLFGPYSWLFWGVQIVLGAFVPLALIYHPATASNQRWLLAAATLVVVGIFAERYYLVVPGLAYPLQYASGTVEGIYGAITALWTTPLEVITALGVFAFMGLLYILGLKYLELLPLGEKGA